MQNSVFFLALTALRWTDDTKVVLKKPMKKPRYTYTAVYDIAWAQWRWRNPFYCAPTCFKYTQLWTTPSGRRKQTQVVFLVCEGEETMQWWNCELEGQLAEINKCKDTNAWTNHRFYILLCTLPPWIESNTFWVSSLQHFQIAFKTSQDKSKALSSSR